MVRPFVEVQGDGMGVASIVRLQLVHLPLRHFNVFDLNGLAPFDYAKLRRFVHALSSMRILDVGALDTQRKPNLPHNRKQFSFHIYAPQTAATAKCGHFAGAANILSRESWHACSNYVLLLEQAMIREGPVSKGEIWSFFTGAMGLDLGLESVGLHPTLANEIDKRFCQTIRTNRPLLDLIEGDVSNLTGKMLRERRDFHGEVYIMVGGPPCQPFSSGGKRAALNDPRGNLIYEYFRLVSEVSPRYFVLENVANLTTAALKHRPIAERPGKSWSLKNYSGSLNREIDGAKPLTEDELSGSALRQIAQDAQSLGYHISFAVVDAADYGAPQHRLRFVMLGSRVHPPPIMPPATHGNGGQPFETVRSAIAHLQSDPGPHSVYTDAVRRYFELVPEGGNWRDLPKELQEEALGGSFKSGGGKTGFYRRLSWDRPSPTITGRANRKGSALCHPASVRPISVREAAALQGFPTDWAITGAMNAQYMQVGNAVPVALGAAIGRAILVHEEEQSHEEGRQPNVEKMMEIAVARLRASARNRASRKKAA